MTRSLSQFLCNSDHVTNTLRTHCILINNRAHLHKCFYRNNSLLLPAMNLRFYSFIFNFFNPQKVKDLLRINML